MRLGQLARKLSLRPSQLVDFLAAHNIETAEGSNTRLEDDHARMIIIHFAPESLEEIMKPSVEPETQPEIEQPAEALQPEPVADAEPELKSENPVTINDETTPEPQGEPEVIRVQRIELSGLKVLGKIDLPEPKKKEPKAEGEGNEELRQERRGKPKHPKRERDTRNLRNPVEVQRQREARELEEKRKAEIEREKEKRKQHYQTKVKQVKAVKRTKADKETGIAKKPIDTRPVPKTWIGKFFRWWTT